MEDKDLQNLFKKLKKSEQSQAPDFDELLQRPRLVKKSAGKMLPLLRWTAAAAVIVGICIGSLWLYSNKAQGEELAAESSTKEKSIENWASKTDELLPDRRKDFFDNEVRQIKIQPSNPIVLNEEIKILLKQVPELKAEDYKYGAISDWESPTDALMPF